MKFYLLVFVVFSLLYMTFEVVFNTITYPKIDELLGKRKISLFGFTSIWMLPFGGIVGVGLNLIYQIPLIHSYVPVFPAVMLIGMILITGLELGGGMLLNVVLKLNIWDYSSTRIKIFGKDIPLNFKGQIDIWHCIGWFFITYLACGFSDLLKWIMR